MVREICHVTISPLGKLSEFHGYKTLDGYLKTVLNIIVEIRGTTTMGMSTYQS